MYSIAQLAATGISVLPSLPAMVIIFPVTFQTFIVWSKESNIIFYGITIIFIYF